MTARIVVLANDVPGRDVCRFLTSVGDQIVRLYLHDADLQKRAAEIAEASGCSPANIYLASALNDPKHVAGLRELRPEFLITVYWAHLLKPDVISAAVQATVNFHPALLPINRGWFPHVHSIIDGTPTGVTLHALDAGADTGPIWAQQPVPLKPTDTAATIYHRLQTEIVELFQRKWPEIKAGTLVPVAQDERHAVYHRKSEINSLDRLDLDRTMRVGDLLNLLRARSFGDFGFAYFEVGGRRVHVNLRLGDEPYIAATNNDSHRAA